MDPILLLPAVVAVGGLLMVSAAVDRVLRETRRLRRAVAGLSELTPALVNIREAGDRLSRSTTGLHRS